MRTAEDVCPYGYRNLILFDNSFGVPAKAFFVLNYCLLAVLPKNLLWGDSLAERVGFEPTARCRVTGFQDQLLKPLGHLSVKVQIRI